VRALMILLAVLAVRAMGLVAACQATPQPIARTWHLPADVKTGQINGHEKAYVERGEDVPVVFVWSLRDNASFVGR
jgi:hypothetical protein